MDLTALERQVQEVPADALAFIVDQSKLTGNRAFKKRQYEGALSAVAVSPAAHGCL